MMTAVVLLTVQRVLQDMRNPREKLTYLTTRLSELLNRLFSQQSSKLFRPNFIGTRTFFYKKSLPTQIIMNHILAYTTVGMSQLFRHWIFLLRFKNPNGIR